MAIDKNTLVDVHQAKQLLKQSPMVLYHGSPYIIQRPLFEKGKIANDYGKGFYLTANEHLANEWAVKNDTNGISNKYHLDLKGLKILDLTAYGAEPLRVEDDTQQPHYAPQQLYWVGMMYEYIHWYYNIPSANLIDILPLETMLFAYVCGHQMGEKEALEYIYETWLKDKF